MFKSLLLSITVLLVVGCASYGSKINMSSVDLIEKGQTTEQEVIRLLGNPMSVSVTSDGRKLLMYMYTHSKVKASTFIPVIGAFTGGANTKTQMVQVWLDEKGVVTSVAHNTSNSALNTGIAAQ